MDTFDTLQPPAFWEEPDPERFQKALGREPQLRIGDAIAYRQGGTQRDILRILAFGYRSFGNNPPVPALLLGNEKTRVKHSMVYDEGTEERYEKVELPLSE